MALLYFTMAAGEAFPPHRHPNSRIIMIWRGSGTAVIRGREISLREHDCFSMPPETVHTFRAGPDGLEIVSVHSTAMHPNDPAFMTLM